MENTIAPDVVERPQKRGPLSHLRERLRIRPVAETYIPTARFETTRGRARILLVEDDVYLRLAIKERLSLDGCDVTEIGDGVSALYCLLSCDYDAVILDLALPSRDGFEVLDEVSAQKELPPVLVLTGGDMDDRYLARTLGASAVLKKPSPYPEVADALSALLDQGR